MKKTLSIILTTCLILSMLPVGMFSISAGAETYGDLTYTIVNDEAAAEKILAEEGYLIKITDVVGVKISDEPGRLSEALKVLNEKKINMEYLYAFMTRTEKHAYVVIRVENNEAAESALANAGFKIVTEADVDKL